MLEPIVDYNEIKKLFSSKFKHTLDEFPEFKLFCYEIFVLGTAYVVGGYIRDIAMKKTSRDLDMVVGLPHDSIIFHLNQSNLNYSINRLNGIKIALPNFYIDLWSIENNWAFHNKLVEKNDDHILESISNGCFYNFDALVINVHTNNLNVRHYNEMIVKGELNILQKNSRYKNLNPSIEGNLLRAFYINERYNINFSMNCKTYLKSRIGFLSDQFGSAQERIVEYLNQYPKYKELLDSQIISRKIEGLFNEEGQQQLDLRN